MVAKKPKKQTDKGEILPPEQADSPANINILAIIQNSQSPKEVLEFLEEHDPGITKRIIQKNEAFADKSQASRFGPFYGCSVYPSCNHTQNRENSDGKQR